MEGEKGGRSRERWDDATRRVQPGDRKWYVLAYGQTAADAAARLPIAHVICTYQYEPCQIYHSARYTGMRFRARSPPAADFIQFPFFRLYVGVVRGINKRADAKRRPFLARYRVAMTRKKWRGNGGQTGQVRGSPHPFSDYTRTWSFQQVRSMLARVRHVRYSPM